MTGDTLFDVSQEIVLITGVSGQLGGEYAKQFLERGARVVGLDIQSSLGGDSLTKQYPRNYLFCTADVTDKASLQKALNSIEHKFGIPTVLINNAAIDSPPSAPPEENGAFEDYPDESWDNVMDVNVKGTYLACKVFGAAMAKNQHGSIINISSIYGVVAPRFEVYAGTKMTTPIEYAAIKSGLIHLTKYMAKYFKGMNIRVNTLSPGGILDSQPESFLKEYKQKCLNKGMLDKEDLKGTLVYLLSDMSLYVNGQNIVVDDGFTL